MKPDETCFSRHSRATTDRATQDIEQQAITRFRFVMPGLSRVSARMFSKVIGALACAGIVAAGAFGLVNLRGWRFFQASFESAFTSD
jgi:hypothetical protein